MSTKKIKLYRLTKTFSNSDGSPYAGRLVEIRETDSNIPVRIYTEAGLVVSTSGETVTNSLGEVTVYVATRRNYTIKVLEKGTRRPVFVSTSKGVDSDVGGGGGSGSGAGLPVTGAFGAVLQRLSTGVRWTNVLDGGDVNGVVADFGSTPTPDPEPGNDTWVAGQTNFVFTGEAYTPAPGFAF